MPSQIISGVVVATGQHEFIDLKLTAAGLFPIFTKFPFNHVLRHANNVNQCSAKIGIFLEIPRLKQIPILKFCSLRNYPYLCN